MKKRYPLLAALLSLLLPGLGQLYNGAAHRAAVFVLASLAAQFTLKSLASATALQSATTFTLMAGAMALTCCLYLFAILDAYAGARRAGELALRRYNRWYVYVLLIAASFGLGFALESSPIHVRSYSLPSSSMAPTLLAGDRITVAANAYRSELPDRGDVVVFEHPRQPGVIYIMRLVGLPGERIKVRGGILHINDEPVPRRRVAKGEQPSPETVEFGAMATIYEETIPEGRSHRIQEISDTVVSDNTGDFRVPPDHYFMMGDNRDNSTDSRFPAVGFIPYENLRGRVLYVYWARDRSRIGTVVE